MKLLNEKLHLETNEKTKIIYFRQGVNAYGFKIKMTYLLIYVSLESKQGNIRAIPIH